MNCFNGEQYLHAAIDSVLVQSYQNWEIVFWDNRSADHSASIVQSYSDLRIKYFYAAEHTLLSEARNLALQKAEGALLGFLDVDDVWLPNKLALQVSLFDDPKVGFACGNYWVQNEQKNSRWLAHRHALPQGYVLDELLMFYFVGLVTLMIRRNALESLGQAFDARYHIIGDLDLVMRLSVVWKLGVTREPVAVYRMHGNNESTKRREKHADELAQWAGEIQSVEAFSSSRNAHFIKSHFAYIKAMNFALVGNKSGAYKLLKLIPWGRLKLRVVSAVLLPRWIVRRVKN